MCKACDYTIHGAQHHFGWDNALVPAERVEPGATILFHCHDSSAGQLGPSSTLADVTALDFGRINPVSGPIYVEGAQPGDAIKVTIDSFAPQLHGGRGFGWTANIPGFGLLADQFTDPALHIWSYDAGQMAPAAWGREGRVPLKEFGAKGRDVRAAWEGRLGEMRARISLVPAAVVTSVHDGGADGVLAAALAIAERIAANSPIAVEGVKAVMNDARASREREDLRRVALWNTAFLSSTDLQEAFMAFAERREPVFK